MTQRFLFRFGFETPRQSRDNALHDWDDESSLGFWVEAESSEQAMALGRDTAEAFVSHLFASAGDTSTQRDESWKSGHFAHWIEEDPEQVFSPRQLDQFPVVRMGAAIDFGDW